MVGRKRLVIDSQKQTADLWQDSEKVATYVVSTAKNGLGCEVGSYCTPTGKLRVAQKIGDGAPAGSIFKARVNIGEIWTFDLAAATANDDLILTRILWLEGAEDKNSNTIYRHIYLHGTNQEHLLGKPVSHGCVRFSNQDIIDVFNRMNIGDEVEIV